MSTIAYRPGDTLVHSLDARAKLAFQVGFSLAAVASLAPRWLAGLAVVATVALALSRVSPVRVLRAYWFVFAILASGPVLAAVSLTRPRFAPGQAVEPTLTALRVALVFFVGAAYVRTTPVRETRAAVQRHVPGRIGRLLGVGMALTVRFVPLLRSDLTAILDAMRARLGDRRSLVDRGRLIGIGGLSRAFTRADRLSVALRARCFAWNPTLPTLRFRRRDYVVAALGVGLACTPLLTLVPGRFIPVG